ncbi:MAG: ribose-phosphate pyrophosphokinase [Bacteroidales bacterium]|nr:ribose-phosphate pyrophosphokinase [Bacteroidales bacterium]
MLNDVHKHRMAIFSCRASREFAEKVIASMNELKGPEDPEITLGSLEVSQFSDGEFQPSFSESVRGATCFIIQSTFPPSDNLMELILAIDACKRASCNKVIAVIPYFGWARQDRKDKPRVSIGAKVVANMLKAAGTDALMVCDLHADQIQGFFDFPVNSLYASMDFLGILQGLKAKYPKTFTIAAPDMGGAKRANTYAKALHCPVVICHKTRARANVVERIRAIGDVEGKDIVIVDDIIDTAGTLTAAANELFKLGAHSVRAVGTHPVLSGPAYERIDSSALEEVYVTDTIPLSSDPEKQKLQRKIKVISMADTFARMIMRVYNYQPISPEFIM